MPINFHDEKNRFTYASREADDTWANFMMNKVDVEGKSALDIGCGGGIYTKKLVNMGACHVTGLDFSNESLAGAREYCKRIEKIAFVEGDALHTKLPDKQYDLVMERAVIHHFQDLHRNFREIHRLLNDYGVCIIQDRTPEDCFLPGSKTHLRGYFFEFFPRLKETEEKRRHSSQIVMKQLKAVGFHHIKEYTFWETRKTYEDVTNLKEDLLNRTGRSILHELSDDELEQLTNHIVSSYHFDEKIVEKDRWTIWIAKKG